MPLKHPSHQKPAPKAINVEFFKLAITVLAVAVFTLLYAVTFTVNAQTSANSAVESEGGSPMSQTVGNELNLKAIHPLEPVSIEYRIRISRFGNAVLGKVQSELTKTDTGYAINSVTKAQGMALLLMQSNLRESCEFEVIDGRAVARRYTGGTIKETQYTVSYDWQNRKINFSDQESLDMPQGYVVDNCIMWFAIALQRGQVDSSEQVYVVDGKSKRIRGYKLRSKDDETISTPLGDKAVTKLVFERELRPNRTLTFWLSKDDQFLPVQIEESRKSRTTTFEISKLDS